MQHRIIKFCQRGFVTGLSAAMCIGITSISGGLNPADAQRIQRIAAIVNDDIVSVYDLRARLRVVIFSSGLRPSEKLQQRLSQQVLRGLIDDRLKMQEAKKKNISVTNRNLQRAIALIEKQNRIPPGTFEAFLQKNHVPRDSIINQIKAQIAWQKLVRRTLLPRVTVGDDEVDETLTRLASRKGQLEYRVSEILLSIDQPRQENEVMLTAKRLLKELRNGASFAAIARQFSQSASAQNGGDLGWLQVTSIDNQLRHLLPQMNEGATIGPIRTLAGAQLIHLSKKRKVLGDSTSDSIVELQQILLPLQKDMTKEEINSQTDLAQILSETISGCKDHLRAAREIKVFSPVKLGRIRLGDLSMTIRRAIENMPIGRLSSPVRIKKGVAVFMVCNRKNAEIRLPSRKEIGTQLRDKRVSLLARQYLRDLRAAAIVDLRV